MLKHLSSISYSITYSSSISMYHYLQLKRTTNKILAYSLTISFHKDFVSSATLRTMHIDLFVVMTTLYMNLHADA